MASSELLISGFADEAANDKTVEQQFVAFAALGLRYLSLRFIDVGTGIKNVKDLNDSELEIILRKLEEYQLEVSSIGSPIGKTKLVDVDDGTSNQFFAFDEYLETQVVKVCEIAKRLNSKLIRGFSFYHPKGESPGAYIEQAAERLSAIAKTCDSFGLTFGLEVEANLIGQNADLLMQLHRIVNNEAMVLIFDGANLVTQGYSESEIVDQFATMQPALGWIHIKDHVAMEPQRKDKFVDEEALCNFVPVGQGAAGHAKIFELLASNLPEISARMKARGVPGVFADLEPHLKGGGQFGGFSGPDGFGIATRALCQLCNDSNISYSLR